MKQHECIQSARVRQSRFNKNRDVKLPEKQKTLLKQIRGNIPDDACYSLNVVWVSGTGWKERIITDQFIGDYLDMGMSDCLDQLIKRHPGDYLWDVHAEEYAFGNHCGSSPVPDNIHALIREFGLDDFLALPEVRLIDSSSFAFELPE